MSTASYLRYFPYEPYDHQREAMDRIDDALGTGTDVLFEGATGTGKTLAALAPALEHAADTDKTVVITTNVHQQMRQFRREASAIAETTDLRAIVFRGKASMCHIDVGYQECQALRDTTQALVETEREHAEREHEQRALLAASQAGDDDAAAARAAVMDELDEIDDELAAFADRATCEHYYRNLTADTDEFFAWLYEDVRTPDEIYEFADERGLCGYELLKKGVEGVELVICNYRHVLDPTIREQFFRWLGRDPEDVIAVVDEAHNVESAARDNARRRLTETTIESALDELAGADAETTRLRAAENVLETFRAALEETYRTAAVAGDGWTDVTIDNNDRRDELTLAFLRRYAGPGYETELETAIEIGQTLDRSYEQAYKRGESRVREECPTLQAARFLETWLAATEAGTYPVVGVRADEAGSGRYGRAELYTCLPRQVTRPLFEELHASVLMSATLRPFDVLADVLGLGEPATIAYGPQFPTSRRRTYAVDGPALFASRRDDPAVQATVTDVLTDAVRMTPGNTLVFCPSYDEADRYHDRVEAGTAYLDEPGTAARELRDQFVADDDGVLFSSLWGTLGEGVSYDGEDARTVVVVGVPYPRLDDRTEAVQAAYNAVIDEPDAGWRYAVEAPTVRKTRQALGRVVRSPDDFGARILLDGRYTDRAAAATPEYAVRETFPPEERAELVDIQPEKLRFGLRNFYAGLDAYGGDPPAP